MPVSAVTCPYPGGSNSAFTWVLMTHQHPPCAEQTSKHLYIWLHPHLTSSSQLWPLPSILSLVSKTLHAPILSQAKSFSTVKTKPLLPLS